MSRPRILTGREFEVGAIADSEFGRRARGRLLDEKLIWLTVVDGNNTPQPNPVWFLWEPELDSLLVYSAADARRLVHIRERPQVSAHFNSDPLGRDVVVLAGVAELAPDAPTASSNDAYMAKYDADIQRIGSTPARFGFHFSEALRIRISHIRGI
jgi:PPOX class probable F420-dependent enzyme